MRNTAILISSNADVHDYLFGNSGDAAQKEEQIERIITQFRTILDTRDDIVNIGIIGKDGKYIINQGLFHINENIELENVEWLQKLMI